MDDEEYRRRLLAFISENEQSSASAKEWFASAIEEAPLSLIGLLDILADDQLNIKKLPDTAIKTVVNLGMCKLFEMVEEFAKDAQ